MSADEQLYNAWDGAVFTQRGMVGRAQCQVTDEADDSLDEGPSARRVEKFDENGQAIVEPYSILGHLSLRVA